MPLQRLEAFLGYSESSLQFRREARESLMTSGRTIQTVDERALFFIRLFSIRTSSGYACRFTLNA